MGEGLLQMGKLRLSKEGLARKEWASVLGGSVPVAPALLSAAYKLWCPLSSCVQEGDTAGFLQELLGALEGRAGPGGGDTHPMRALSL